MIKVALTGNIACGKSEVQKILLDLGYKVFDTDVCAHSILENNISVIKEFGTNSRNELSKIVFYDKKKLNKLEEILHPLIKEEIFIFFQTNQSSNLAFVAVPQLFEAGFDIYFDKIIFISSNYNLRLERLMKRNSYSREYAILRLNSQANEKEKIEKSDFVIENNSSLEDLKIKVIECLKLLL